MCFTPVTLKDENRKEFTVPCGKCPACVKRRAIQWSFRLMQEEKVSTSAYFITLTYDNKHVPITGKGFLGLCKSDLQKFFKRLRKCHKDEYCVINGRIRRLEKPTIKYYAVGEYGGRTMRPHYHIILFNAELELIQEAWCLNGKPLGNIYYGTVQGASVGYVLKYMSKTRKVPLHQNDDRSREFAIMSKKLGISYLTRNMLNWHDQDKDERMYCNIPGGGKIGMPRYFKERVYEKWDRQRIGQKLLEKMRTEEYKEAAKNPQYARNKQQAIISAFRQMNYQAGVNTRI